MSAAGVVGVAEQADDPAHRGQRVGAGRLDAGQRLVERLGVSAGGDAGGLRLDHDAGDVVGDDVVQLPWPVPSARRCRTASMVLPRRASRKRSHNPEARAATTPAPGSSVAAKPLGVPSRMKPRYRSIVPAATTAPPAAMATTRADRQRPGRGPDEHEQGEHAAPPGWPGRSQRHAASSAAPQTARPAAAAHVRE